MRRSTWQRLVFDVSWGSLWKVLVAATLVWIWLQLWQLFLLVVVAVLLAVTLDPVVARFQRLGLPRWGASTLVGFVILATIVGFFDATWSSLAWQARLLGSHVSTVEQDVINHIPPIVRDAFGVSVSDNTIQSYLVPAGARLVRALTGALLIFAMASILTLYLLIEGHKTYAWLRAFVPKRLLPKTDQTVAEARRVVFAYVAGNVATSVFATLFVLAALTILKVPAALLLAVLAGVCDFVPVAGFVVSAIPAVVLALTVSPATAALVLLLYGFYHFLENYFIGPRVYGEQLELSNVAVVLAFAVGAELAGVVGALIALPVAAAYPAIERIWLRDRLGEEVVIKHRAIQQENETERADAEGERETLSANRHRSA
jgi:predicted PurR-regulated permease PerM